MGQVQVQPVTSDQQTYIELVEREEWSGVMVEIIDLMEPHSGTAMTFFGTARGPRRSSHTRRFCKIFFFVTFILTIFVFSTLLHPQPECREVYGVQIEFDCTRIHRPKYNICNILKKADID